MQDIATIEHAKHPGGRPTKFRPEMCEQVIELGKTGASKAEMALELDIAMSTFALWEQQIPEFSEAVKRASQLSRGWWEKKGRLATFDSKDFSATSYIFQMKNRFREDWSDRTVNEVVGKDDGAIEIKDSSTDARKVAFMLGRAVGRAEKAKAEG